MTYTLYFVVLAACLGGAAGGLVHAMLVGPLNKPAWKGSPIDPGAMQHMFIGLVAGFVSWLPSLATYSAAGHAIGPPDLIGACGSAIFVGISGAKWLTSAADRQQSDMEKAQLREKRE